MKIDIEDILVSVIIPVYNCEKWIRKTLYSVLNQSYNNLEIIIVNDGSTDNTDKILKEFIKYNRVYIYNINNSGPAKARNYGVSRAKGELIAFLDADDLWDTKKIEKQVSYFKKYKCDLLITNVVIINENDEVIGKQQKNLPETQKEQVISFFQGKITMNTPTIMVKRSVFYDVGGFNEDLINKEDHFFLMKVANKYKMHLLEEYLVYRRKRKESMSTNFKRQEKNEKKLVDFYYKSRYHFYDISIKTFPFLQEYLNVEIGKFHHNLGMLLYRSGFVKSAKKYLKKAITYDFKFKYLVKLSYLYLPNYFRKLILSFYDKYKNSI